MSFGFSVGDVIAVLSLFERVAVEVRHYRDAPRHFQQLDVELQLLRTTLQRLLQVEPGDEEERQQLEHIRAIAMHCRQPLQSFINKMRPRETCLGPGKSVATLGNIGRRLHWSLITRSDVDELRKVMMSEMTAINLLLAVQQMASLKKLRVQTNQDASQELQRSRAKSHDFMTDSKAIFQKLEKLPEDVTSLRSVMAKHCCRQDEFTTNAYTEMQTLSSNSRAVVRQGNTILGETRSLGDRVSQSIETLMMVARDVRKILYRLKFFSKSLSDNIAANAKTLLDIHAMMKRLIRAVEAIPLHLTLAVVRLDDALGESWALPFQVCQDFQGFQDILETVVFAGNRPGSVQVNLNRFIMRCAKSGSRLREDNWETLVKQGGHLSQAVILYATKPSARECPFAECNGLLENGNKACPTCGRESSFQIATATRIRIDSSSGPHPSLEGNRGFLRKSAFGPTDMSSNILEMKEEKLEIKDFRNIHFVERRKHAVKSHSEATDLLNLDSSDPSALHYLGWWHLCNPSGRIEDAVEYLKRSIESDPDCMESHYLLARAFMASETFNARPLHEAFQLAIYRGGYSTSTVFASVAICYYNYHQYRDCLDHLARSIRLNQHEPLVWRNLGVLYDHCHDQQIDAYDAYTRALDLGLVDEQCLERHHALQMFIRFGATLEPATMAMKDFDLNEATYDVDETSARHLVELPALKLDRESEKFENDAADGLDTLWEDYESGSESCSPDNSSPEDIDEQWEDYESDSEEDGSEIDNIEVRQ